MAWGRQSHVWAAHARVPVRRDVAPTKPTPSLLGEWSFATLRSKRPPLGSLEHGQRPYGRSLYRSMRARGLRHERALRGLTDRLLACLIATLRNDELYDSQQRARGVPGTLAA